MLSICCNPELVEDINEVPETLELAMNGGVLITIQKATVPQYVKCGMCHKQLQTHSA
jgi:uncharacterized protein YlzI (FlbEa/FlbD family)